MYDCTSVSSIGSIPNLFSYSLDATIGVADLRDEFLFGRRAERASQIKIHPLLSNAATIFVRKRRATISSTALRSFGRQPDRFINRPNG
jgi:hypothetical protein